VQKQLPHYLRTLRRSSGLYQYDLGFLLDLSDAEICRYEMRRSVPPLAVALKYSSLFQVAIPDLFSGLNSQLEAEVRRRVGELLNKLESGDAGYRDPLLAQRLLWLNEVRGQLRKAT